MKIDCDKLRSAVFRLDNDRLRNMLDDALGLLPPAKLAKLAERYVDLASLQATKPAGGLLAEVKAFDKASRAGDYYESFNVNSKNYRDISGGTRAWIAECRRLLDLCVKASGKGKPEETCEAFEMIFALLEHIDECLDDIIFLPTKADRGRLALTGRRCCRHGSPASRRSPSLTSMPVASSTAWTALRSMPATLI